MSLPSPNSRLGEEQALGTILGTRQGLTQKGSMFFPAFQVKRLTERLPSASWGDSPPFHSDREPYPAEQPPELVSAAGSAVVGRAGGSGRPQGRDAAPQPLTAEAKQWTHRRYCEC